MVNKKRFTDREFQKLAARINKTLIANEGVGGDQKKQVEAVMDLERYFFNAIKRYAKAVQVYALFIRHINHELGNILNAKPFFRESPAVFNKSISPALRSNNPRKLLEFHGNYNLIHFIVNNWGGPLPDHVQSIYDRFLKARSLLIENNLPLAINRAKIFYRSTPESHLLLIDFIDICIQGLITGIDKYVGEYTTVWRSVCIGRMVGFMIEEYSKTLIRMYPTDKKILYRINSLRHTLKTEDIKILTKALNESFLQDEKEGKAIPKLPIFEDFVVEILNGASHLSADSTIEDVDGSGSVGIYDITASSDDIAEEVENRNAWGGVLNAAKQLNLLETKIIRLKGVDI
jgi:hypothetical protein